MTVWATEQISPYLIGPLFSHTTAAGGAETAVATRMHRDCLAAGLALKENVALAGVVAEEHPLDLPQLMLAKGRFMKT